MLEIVLVQPEIPPNAGNVIRLAANTGARLHLVEPLGFSMGDRQLKRAGLDYHEIAQVKLHKEWNACRAHFAGRRMFAFTTKARKLYADVRYAAGDVLVFGAETAGLPEKITEEFPADMRLKLPMRPDNRSLNLSNAVAVVVYEAWRQLGFPGRG
ncbi:MAG TPA: tRNA (cytidine(34)-2'-O)-methyltransferase [Burkholderiales bacterium]|nr:tRNA (cytidine(34)-2'-O)-methyltransferase [Burkholderiales bacterium]